MTREEIAEKLFKEDGYNCSQSVCLAFKDIAGIDERTLLNLSAPFGGGMGRLREVCGAVSGMFTVLGFLTDSSDPKNSEAKKELYEKVQNLAGKFKEENGSIICRELLGLSVKSEAPVPEKRSEDYYKKRPCLEMVKSAVRILEKELDDSLKKGYIRKKL